MPLHGLNYPPEIYEYIERVRRKTLEHLRPLFNKEFYTDIYHDIDAAVQRAGENIPNIDLDVTNTPDYWHMDAGRYDFRVEYTIPITEDSIRIKMYKR